jgi:hypothetical protein
MLWLSCIVPVKRMKTNPTLPIDCSAVLTSSVQVLLAATVLTLGLLAVHCCCLRLWQVTAQPHSLMQQLRQCLLQYGG